MTEDTHHPAEDEGALVKRLAALPRSIEPAYDLWPAVQARIAPPPRQSAVPWSIRFGRAAGVVLMLLGALLAGTWFGYDHGRQVATRAARAPAPGIEVERLELAFAAARESYLRQLALGGERLGEPERAALGSQLAVIDQAVHELRDAMTADPRNPLYIDTLLMTREREMELLADISSTTFTRM